LQNTRSMGLRNRQVLMNKYIYFSIFIFALLTSCLSNKNIKKNGSYEVRLDTFVLFDQSRQRDIPIAIYRPDKDGIKAKHKKIVIFSHGYYHNKSGSYLKYSYLTRFLASKDYYVVSIQHELSTDSLLPLTGNTQVLRRPFWERGADNILFVINYLRKTNPELDFKNITLIGHSNGADIAALFPQKYPDFVNKIITLDNRRMVLPKSKKLKVLSLRSSDQTADEGVLPTEKEQNIFGIKIIKLPMTKHNDMDDNANTQQRKEINDYILTFLNK